MNERLRALQSANRSAAATLRKALEQEPRVAEAYAEKEGRMAYYPHLCGGLKAAMKMALSCLERTACHTCADTGIELGSRPGSRAYCHCEKGQALAELEADQVADQTREAALEFLEGMGEPVKETPESYERCVICNEQYCDAYDDPRGALAGAPIHRTCLDREAGVPHA